MHAQQEALVQQGFLVPLDRPDRLDLQISPCVVNRKGLADFPSTPCRKYWPNRTDGRSWRNWIDRAYWSYR